MVAQYRQESLLPHERFTWHSKSDKHVDKNCGMEQYIFTFSLVFAKHSTQTLA